MLDIELNQSIHEQWMRLALVQAKLAEAQGEVPVGAVIVHQGQVIGQGFNCPITTNDPTAHAEIQAIRNACQNLQNYRLPEGSTLYATLEPCTQCVGALVHARIGRVIFAAAEPRAGSLISARQLMSDGFYNHFFTFKGGCLADQSAELLRQFFKTRRQHSQTNSKIKP
ncbi:tRNA adenosine(34) deaminase TadA [Acinetobacter sp. A3.8]|uniref:tRNA-specific adenosine deaminase n=1 Tax=Acinetobacter sedimenti TaxID=2919922 RepID=A0A9X1WYP5_9GAMM|nr:tRNA adenosine(34) deaminase TadA [Acinetobacter sedimenti]MCJ8146457.1 tRNA adenosine(34) deaminase TadA [Acinetobacter sedimenti]